MIKHDFDFECSGSLERDRKSHTSICIDNNNSKITN